MRENEVPFSFLCLKKTFVNVKLHIPLWISVRSKNNETNSLLILQTGRTFSFAVIVDDHPHVILTSVLVWTCLEWPINPPVSVAPPAAREVDPTFTSLLIYFSVK